jgi:hypothetical protein
MAILQFPPNPTTGQIFAATNGINYTWDGVKWLGKGFIGNPPMSGTSTYVLTPPSTGQIGGVKAGAGVTIGPDGTISVPDYSQAGPTPPTTNLQDGDLWYDTNDGNLYVRYNGVWVSAVTTVAGAKGDVGPPGPPGPSGPGFVEKGAWSANAFYRNNDVVFYRGNSYAALQSSQNKVPTTEASFWALFASQGPAGPQGPQGVTGAPGPKGDKGDASAIATSTVAGSVKVAGGTTYVNIDVDGTISVPKGAGINTVTDISNVNSTAGGAALNDGALLIYNASSERWDTVNNLRSDEMDGGFF